MESFVIITAYLLIGVALRRTGKFHAETGNVLNSFVIYVSLPAVILLKVPELTLSAELLVPAVMPWVMLLFSVVAVLFVSRVFTMERQVTGVLLLLVPLGNTSFLGYPMVRAFLGERAVSYAVLYDQIGSFPALAIYGSIIAAIYGVEKGGTTTRNTIRDIVTFPSFIAFVAAFALRPFHYPAMLVSLLSALAATLVPVVMICIGFQLTLRVSQNARKALFFGLLIKLIVAPLAALALCKACGLRGDTVKVSVFEAGMPPMVSAGALALLAGLPPSLTTALVGMGLILSFVTLPLLYWLL